MLRVAAKVGGRRVNSNWSVPLHRSCDSPHFLLGLRKTRLKSKSTNFDKNSSQASSRSPPTRNHSRLMTRTVWPLPSRWNWTAWPLPLGRGVQATSRARLSTAKSRKKTSGSGSLRGLSERGSKRRNERSCELKRRSGKQKGRRGTG
jgi:hypothetical protein